jgi:drug/metabolite transporter (DMT)-like permease
MGYLFLVFALLAGVTKGYCGKKTSGFLSGFRDSMMANMIRMGLCIVIGFLIVLFGGDLQALAPSGKLLLISALSGVFTSVFVVSWLVSVKKSAYMMLDVFLMLGVLIPLLASSIFFRERIDLTQWIGIAILFVAVIIMCSYNNSIKEKLTLPALLLLIVCGAANGIADFSQKLFVKQLPEVPASVFNFYTYVFAAITLVIAYLLMKPQGQETGKANFKKVAGYILVMAICLFANSFFKTLAANHLDSVLLYPLNQGAALILSSAMSALLFKEKLTAKCIIGLVIAFVSLIIINVL